ncbi:RNA polymerase sigma factor [Maribacter sp. X9]|uniref:RNA polymerase sigma factor n=1 Tax=Maribacter sp. X9 TaxID=3402159 RepID=UPI003AF36174
MGNNLDKANKQLVTAFKNNDQMVMQKVYQKLFPKFRNHVFKNSGDEAQAKDIFQEAFVACWKNVKDDKFDGNGNLEAYLFTIAKNKWTDHIRSIRFRRTVQQEAIPIVVEEENNDPHGASEREQEMMITALNQLGGACKELLTLFYFERRSMEEIGVSLGLAPASARNKKYRCMEQLRTLAKKIKNDG